jgi:hypothetical protein
MAVSGRTRNRSRTEFWRQLSNRVSRYDLLLALVPLVFALSLVVSALTGLSLETALAGGGLASGLCFVDAVYLNPPVESASDA